MAQAQCLETIPHALEERGLRFDRVLSAFRASLQNQRENAFLWVPVLFSCGIGAYFSLPFEPPLLPLVIICIMVFSGLILVVHRNREGVSANPAFVWYAIVATVFSGVVCAKIRTIQVQTPIIEKKMNWASISGVIDSVEALPGKQGSRIVLSDVEIEGFQKNKTPRMIRLQVRKDENLWAGQRIRVSAQLNAPSDALYPGGYDFRRAFYFQGIGAVGFAFKAPEIIEGSASMPDLQRFRQNMAERIRITLPGPEGEIVVALTVGQKKGIEDRKVEILRDSGLAHILAISGLHVGLVAGTVFFFVRLFLALFPAIALRYPIKKIAAFLAFLAALSFMIIAGSTIPTQRAVLMISIVLLAVAMDRVALSLRLLSFAALVILVLAPESLLSASFQMSFAAVTALIGTYEVTRKFWIGAYAGSGWLTRTALYFLGVCLSSLIASAATAPFSAFHFHQVALYGIFANLAAIPLLAFIIMPAGVLSFFLMPFGLEYWPLQIMGWGVELILESADATAELPGAVLQTPLWPFSAFILIVWAGLVTFLWRGTEKLVFVPSLVFLSVFLIALNPLPDILIASEGKLAAFRTDDANLFVTTKRAEKFTRENWESMMALPEGSSLGLPYESGRQDHVKAAAAIETMPLCDPQACRIIVKSHRVSFLRHPYAQAQECAWADIVIGFEPIRKQDCNSRIVIDRFDQWRYGAYSLFLEVGQEPVIQKTRKENGMFRPWSIIRPARRDRSREKAPKPQES